MSNILIRLFLVAILLCDFLGSGTSVRAHGITLKDGQNSEEQITQNDGHLMPMAEEPQSPFEVVFRSAPSSNRIASSRPTRLLPTHGGKPGKHNGRWTEDEVHNPFNCLTQQLCRKLRLSTIATPPRLYYVIALRRLLC